jgi:type I restriction enzyme R subunit
MNQTPEQMARDNIDKQLSASGWIIQNKKQMNLNAGLGVAVREYQTDAGHADYVLFVGVKPVGSASRLTRKRTSRRRRQN